MFKLQFLYKKSNNLFSCKLILFNYNNIIILKNKKKIFYKYK